MRLQVKRYTVLSILLLLFFLPLSARAAYLEQLAISTRANSLANSVTADPPGLMSIHYNPAGLLHLPDGLVIGQEIFLPFINFKHKFTDDPDHALLPGADEFNNDPVAGQTGKTTKERMYLPFYDDTIDFLVAPSLGLAYQEEDSRWAFATGSYVPFGGGYVHGGDDNPARFGVKDLYLQHLIYLAPSVAYRLSDKLSVGLTVGGGQTAMGVTVCGRAPNELVAVTKAVGNATQDLEIPILSELTLPPPWFGGGISPFEQAVKIEFSLRDDFTPNYNLGLLWEPNDWFAFGFTYQSPIEVKLTGKYKFSYSEEWQRMAQWLGRSPITLMTAGILDLPHQPVESESGYANVDITFPQRMQFGFMVKPIDRLKLLLDFHWADWSELDKFEFQFDKDIQFLKVVKLLGYTGGNDKLVLDRELRDRWNVSVGLEYQLLDWLALRLGYADRKSSISTGRFDLMSLVDMDVYSTGAGISLSNGMLIDLAFVYMVNKSFDVENNSSRSLNSTLFTDAVYNPYNGLDYSGDFELYILSAGLTIPFEVMQSQIDHALALLLEPFGIDYRPHRGDKVESGGLESPAGTTLAMPATARTAAAGQNLTEIQLPYALRLARFATPERARVAAGYYTANGIIPYRVRVTDESGEASWYLLQGAYATKTEALEAKEALMLSEARVELTPFACQIGIFESEPASRTTARLMADLGYDAYPIEDGDGKVRLLTGAFEAVAEAGQLRNRLAAQGIEGMVVHRAVYAEAPQAMTAPADRQPVAADMPPHFAGQLPYSLRLAEFADESRARMALDYYRTDGLEPYLVRMEEAGTEGWMVLAGAYPARQDALAARADLLLNEADPLRTPYACLAGIFKSEADADDAVERLEELGYTPYAITDEQGTIYLLVGAFAEKEAAESLSAALGAQGFPAPVVLRALSMQTAALPYSLQLARFQSEARAQMALTYYRSDGLAPYLVKSGQGETPSWMVCAGTYRSEAEALAAGEALGLAESLPVHTPYACEIGRYFAGESPDDDLLEGMESLGFTPYTVTGFDGSARLLVGAFATWQEAENFNFTLDMNGIVNQIVER